MNWLSLGCLLDSNEDDPSATLHGPILGGDAGGIMEVSNKVIKGSIANDPIWKPSKVNLKK